MGRGDDRRRRLPARRFAALAVMTPEERAEALGGPEKDAWIEAAAQFGLVDGQALFAESLFRQGRTELALRWFRAAAGGGHAAACNMVGRCLEKGWGTAVNLPDAARHYRRAAEAGDGWGAFNLAMALLYGLGLPKNREEAFEWFGVAAERDNPKAANMLGRFYEEGWGREPDLRRAASCYRAGAVAGDFRAQFNLGTMLLGSGERAEALSLIQTAWGAGSEDFLSEAGAALRRSGDAELAAIAGG